MESGFKLLERLTIRLYCRKEYEAVNIFAFPSRWESSGLTLTEAYQAGYYLLTSPYMSLSYSIIKDGKNGEIIAEYTVDAWVEAIMRNTKSEQDWDELCEEGFREVKEQYFWDNIVKRLYQLIDFVDSLFLRFRIYGWIKSEILEKLPQDIC